MLPVPEIELGGATVDALRVPAMLPLTLLRVLGLVFATLFLFLLLLELAAFFCLLLLETDAVRFLARALLEPLGLAPLLLGRLPFGAGRFGGSLWRGGLRRRRRGSRWSRVWGVGRRLTDHDERCLGGARRRGRRADLAALGCGDGGGRGRRSRSGDGRDATGGFG